MRSNYNILWLDDEFSKRNSSINTTVQRVKAYMESKGFECCVEQFKTFEDAMRFLNTDKKVDLFISDYNIGGDNKTGLDFLKFVRNKYRKEMFLYSNNDVDEIKDYVVGKLNSGEIPLNFFSKFTFQSTIRPDVLLRDIKEVIDETLIRWEELNALRGLFLAELSQREENLKRYIISKNGDTPFIAKISTNFDSHTTCGDRSHLRTVNSDVISEVGDLISCLTSSSLRNNSKGLSFFNMGLILCDYSNPLYNDWESIRKLRNGFAHVSEDSVAGTITLKDRTVINKGDIYFYRVKLLKFLRAIDGEFC